MEHHNSAPVLITGGARRIGLALARSFLQRDIPVIIAYRSDYPALKELKGLGRLAFRAIFRLTKAFTALPNGFARPHRNCVQ